METTFQSIVGDREGKKLPNLILKQKLAPLPLLQQSLYGNKMSELFSPSTTTIMKKDFMNTENSPTRTMKKSYSAVNNYGRLCDQPFLEFSSYHQSQIIGTGSTARKMKLPPIDKKKNKTRIQKLFIVNENQNKKAAPQVKEPAIRIEVAPEEVGVNRSQDHYNQYDYLKEHPARIKRQYQYGDHIANLTFTSFEVQLNPRTNTGHKVSLLLPLFQMNRIYQGEISDIIETLSNSIFAEADEPKIRLNLTKKIPENLSYEKFPKSEKGNPVEIKSNLYDIVINFPNFELTIDDINYQGNYILSSHEVHDLVEAKFSDFEEYLNRFEVDLTQNQSQNNNKDSQNMEELESLPPLIKKVIKTEDFSGLVIFKSMLIRLTNTADIEPETIVEDKKLSAIDRKILESSKKNVQNFDLWVPVKDLAYLFRLNIEELSNVVETSIEVEPGKGFSFKLDQDKRKIWGGLKPPKLESYPTKIDSFIVRFNKFLYDVTIIPPSLELYIPDASYKDILTPDTSLLENLFSHNFKNLGDHVSKFQRPVEITERNKVLIIDAQEGESDEYSTICRHVKSVSETNGLLVEVVNLSDSKYELLNTCIENFRLNDLQAMEQHSKDPNKTVHPIIKEDLPKIRRAHFIIFTFSLDSKGANSKIEEYLKHIKQGKGLGGKKKVGYFVTSNETDNKKGLNTLRGHFKNNILSLGYKPAKFFIINSKEIDSEYTVGNIHYEMKGFENSEEKLEEDKIEEENLVPYNKFQGYEVVAVQQGVLDTHLRRGIIKSIYKDDKIYCLVTLTSMALTLERWDSSKNKFKFEGNLVLNFYALASLISHAETGNVSEYLKENLEIHCIQDPRRPNVKRYRLNYMASYTDTIVSHSVNENHVQNGILSDFEYETNEHEEKFRIKVKAPSLDIYDPQDSVNRIVKLEVETLSNITEKSFNVTLSLRSIY